MLRLATPLLALVAAVAAAPAAPVAPVAPRSSTPGCSDRSFHDFAWDVTGFAYNGSWTFSTPAHQIDNGHVAFTVRNPALGAGDAGVVECSADSSQLQDFFYGTQIYTCAAAADPSVTTTFTFNYAGPHTLTLNQTWSCSDKDAQYPTTFHYAGKANLALTCSESAWQNPNWTMGEIYSSKTRTCSAADLAIKPYQVEAVA